MVYWETIYPKTYSPKCAANCKTKYVINNRGITVEFSSYWSCIAYHYAPCTTTNILTGYTQQTATLFTILCGDVVSFIWICRLNAIMFNNNSTTAAAATALHQVENIIFGWRNKSIIIIQESCKRILSVLNKKTQKFIIYLIKNLTSNPT